MCYKASEYNCNKCNKKNTYKCSLIDMAKSILSNRGRDYYGKV